MENDEKERKELQEAVRILLKTTEDLKSTLTPLIQGQAHALQVIDEHGEAIGSLMDKLIGTREEHLETLRRLDFVESSVSQLTESFESIQELNTSLKERLKRLEFGQISPIVQKIIDSIPPSSNDLRNIDNLLTSYPDNEYLLSIKAKALGTSGRTKDALKLLEDAIHKEPNSPRLLYEKGMLIQDFNEALKSFNKSLELLKDGPKINQHLVFLARASLLAGEGKFEDALDSATKSVEMDPDRFAAWGLKGEILLRLGRIPEALGCFEKAIELNSEVKETWYLKGKAQSALGPMYVENALSSYDIAIKIDSKWASPYFDKGSLFLKINQYEKALQSFDAGLRFDDQVACAWCDRGVALNRLERNEEALESFDRALELGPPKKCGQIFYDMAIVRYHTARFEDGLNFAKRAIKTDPDNAMYLSILASCLTRLNKESEALEIFERALKLKKSDTEIDWDDLAELYRRIGREKEAEEARQKFEATKKSDQNDKTNV